MKVAIRITRIFSCFKTKKPHNNWLCFLEKGEKRVKRLILCVSILLIGGLAWGQDYPNPTMEQVNFSPENYEGTTVYFDGATFQPDFRKVDEFNPVIYTFYVKSKNGDYYIELHYGHSNSGEINFYVTKGFAGELINAQIEPGNHKANLLCTVEKQNATIWPYEEQTYWLCKVIKIELLDSEGNITKTYVETGQPLPSPCEEAVKTERARWDVNGDDKIGLEEAIRALQVVSGIRD
ncbi:MAG: hypothetical protein AB7S75_06810 [Desulfococcaceae bacterium]